MCGFIRVQRVCETCVRYKNTNACEALDRKRRMLAQGPKSVQRVEMLEKFSFSRETLRNAAVCKHCLPGLGKKGAQTLE